MGQPRRAVPQVISVWVVEDHQETRHALKELIDAHEGMDCPKAFENGEDLLAYSRDNFLPEVIVSDIGLRGMNGVQLVERLRPIASGTAVVMLTAHEDKEKIHDALRAGASGYLTKPLSSDELIQAIQDVTQGGAVMSPSVARKVLEIFAQKTIAPYDYKLTAREQEVLEELVAGKTKKRIAKDLFLSPNTVDTHLRSIYVKLHVNTQTAAVAKAFREGLVK
jgi:DNA-binding NarL/FixJ family response regulator